MEEIRNYQATIIRNMNNWIRINNANGTNKPPAKLLNQRGFCHGFSHYWLLANIYKGEFLERFNKQVKLAYDNNGRKIKSLENDKNTYLQLREKLKKSNPNEEVTNEFLDNQMKIYYPNLTTRFLDFQALLEFYEIVNFLQDPKSIDNSKSQHNTIELYNIIRPTKKPIDLYNVFHYKNFVYNKEQTKWLLQKVLENGDKVFLSIFSHTCAFSKNLDENGKVTYQIFNPNFYPPMADDNLENLIDKYVANFKKNQFPGFIQLNAISSNKIQSKPFPKTMDLNKLLNLNKNKPDKETVDICNKIDKKGFTRLEFFLNKYSNAKISYNIYIIKNLINHGADIKKCGKTDLSPLTIAIVNDNIDLLKFLIKKDAPVNPTSEQVNNDLMKVPLYRAIYEAKPKMVEELLKSGAKLKLKGFIKNNKNQTIDLIQVAKELQTKYPKYKKKYASIIKKLKAKKEFQPRSFLGKFFSRS